MVTAGASGHRIKAAREASVLQLAIDNGPNGYVPGQNNVGFNHVTGQIQIEIKGLAQPKSQAAARICQEDLNEVIAAFVQDKTAVERGLFDQELVPEELTQVRMATIVKTKYPELDDEDQEALRQHAIAALNITQQAKQQVLAGSAESALTAPRITPEKWSISRSSRSS